MNKSFALGLAALGLLVATGANAQSTTQNAWVRIIRPITITSTEEMNFGALYSTSGVQTVTITPNNSNTAESPSLRSGASLITTQGAVDASADIEDHDGIEQGQFTLSGEAGFAYTINASSTPAVAQSPTVGANMAIGNVKVNHRGLPVTAASNAPFSASFAGTSTVFQLADATADYNFGASLTVAANQAPGIYKGTVTISAAYN